MKISKLLLSLSLISLLSLLVSCASGPELQKYPTREIDRPYTLPEGVAAWHIPTMFGYVKDNQSSTTIPPIPFPLIWESALSDDWNLIWYPLPLGVSHQITNSDMYRLGVSFTNGFSYSSSSGFYLIPDLALSYRLKLTSDTALDFVPSIGFEIPLESPTSYLQAGLNIGPLFQLNERFALKSKVLLKLEPRRFAHSGNDQSGRFQTQRPDSSHVFNGGVSIEGFWSLARQWDLKPSYTYTGIGGINGEQTHIGMIEFVHLW